MRWAHQSAGPSPARTPSASQTAANRSPAARGELWSRIAYQVPAAPSAASPERRSCFGRPIGNAGPSGDAVQAEPIAAKFWPTTDGSVQEIASQGTKGGGAPLPHLDAIQASFGRHDVSGVAAHVGGSARPAAEAIGAAAYTTGNHVAFREAPDLRTAAHEAAHVVQQRTGVSLKGGVGRAGDAHERHADEVAERVATGQSAAPLLDRYASPATGHGGGGVQKQVQRVPAPEKYWSGSVKGHLGENPSTYHTINNFGDTQLRYKLRITNTGYCLLDLGTQYKHQNSEEPEREWIALAVQRGKSAEVTNGLPPHSSLRLRLFGERDYTDPDQSYIEGKAESELVT